MGDQILNNQNSFSSSCLDTTSLAQPYPLLPVFCKAVPISADGQSQWFGRVLWLRPSLSHKRRTDGFLWASLASSIAKLSLTFALSPSYIFVCASL